MDLSIIFILLTGLGLGLAHSLDPDHVVAVSTLLCNNKSLRKSITSATVWGIGHSVVLFIIGLLVLTLSVVIPQSVLRLSDAAVGVLLIILGAIVLRPLIAERIHPRKIIHEHTHSHTHSYPHTYSRDHENDNHHGHTHLHKSAITGALQGVGGSAALMLVTLSTVSSIEIGLVFILLFGVGVILGMMGIACLVGSVIAYTASNLERVHKIIKSLTGTVSISLGIVIVVYALV
jgi:ABC-type nickel/cobalt efflux system permease component RcnA